MVKIYFIVIDVGDQLDFILLKGGVKVEKGFFLRLFFCRFVKWVQFLRVVLSYLEFIVIFL